jgi:hypothetical protein
MSSVDNPRLLSQQSTDWAKSDSRRFPIRAGRRERLFRCNATLATASRIRHVFWIISDKRVRALWACSREGYMLIAKLRAAREELALHAPTSGVTSGLWNRGFVHLALRLRHTPHMTFSMWNKLRFGQSGHDVRLRCDCGTAAHATHDFVHVEQITLRPIRTRCPAIFTGGVWEIVSGLVGGRTASTRIRSSVLTTAFRRG